MLFSQFFDPRPRRFSLVDELVVPRPIAPVVDRERMAERLALRAPASVPPVAFVYLRVHHHPPELREVHSEVVLACLAVDWVGGVHGHGAGVVVDTHASHELWGVVEGRGEEHDPVGGIVAEFREVRVRGFPADGVEGERALQRGGRRLGWSAHGYGFAVLEPPNDLGGEEVLFWSPFSDRRHLWGARRKDDDDGLASEGEDPSSGYRRYQCRREAERRGDDEGHEAEESPSHKGAVRARGEEALELQGMQWVSARSSALYMQGVRWGINLRARS